MKWYWIVAIVIISIVVGYILALSTPAQKNEECHCIKDKLNKLKIKSPAIVTTEQITDIIKKCCKPPIVEQQEKGRMRLFRPIQARLKRKVRKCLDSGGMYDHLLDKCVFKDDTGQWV